MSDENEDMETQVLHSTAKLLAVGTAVVLGAVYLFWLIWGFNSDARFIEIMYGHLAAVVGIPGAIITAFVLVNVLENISGPIKFKGLGFEFEGASGPIVMWVIVYCALVGSLKLLW